MKIHKAVSVSSTKGKIKLLTNYTTNVRAVITVSGYTASADISRIKIHCIVMYSNFIIKLHI